MDNKSPLARHRARFIDNLRRIYNTASDNARVDGAKWYPEARAIVGEWSAHYALSIDCVASVVAAISPQCEWSRNLVIAEDVLSQQAISIGGALSANISKARHLRDSGANGEDCLALMLRLFPGGPKVNCFARNLAGDDYFITVDTHAIQAAFDDVKVTINPKWAPYSIIAECYAIAAQAYRVTPATFQAIVWHAWKEAYPREVKKQARKRW